MCGKYIIFIRAGMEFPVLIPNHFVSHNEIQGNFADKPVSAGFFKIADGKVTAYGQSISLKLESRAGDSSLIAKQFGIID